MARWAAGGAEPGPGRAAGSPSNAPGVGTNTWPAAEILDKIFAQPIFGGAGTCKNMKKTRETFRGPV